MANARVPAFGWQKGPTGPTPGGELVAKMKPVLEEVGKRHGLSIKSVESGGTSLKRRLTG